MHEVGPGHYGAPGNGPFAQARRTRWPKRAHNIPVLRLITIALLAVLLAVAVWNHFLRDSVGTKDFRESYEAHISVPASQYRQEHFLRSMHVSELDYPDSTMVSAVRAACDLFSQGSSVGAITVWLPGPEQVLPGIHNQDLPRIIGNGVIAYCPEHIPKLTRYRYELENSLVTEPYLYHFTEGLLGG